MPILPSIRRGGYFEEIAAVNGPSKPDLAGIKEIMLRHGLVPAG